MSKKLTLLLAMIAIIAMASIALASDGMKIRLDGQSCVPGGGFYRFDVTLQNLRDVPGTVTSYATHPGGGEPIKDIFPGTIGANATVSGSFVAPNQPTGEAEVYVTIAWDDGVSASDRNGRGISGHCPADPTPTSTTEPTATPTDLPTVTPTATVTETLEPSASPTGTITPGQTAIPTETPTGTATSQPATETPVSEATGTPVHEQQQPTPSSTPIEDCEEECEIATCELGEDGHTTRYQSQVLEKTAYLQVRYDGIQVEGGSSHTTVDGLEVSMKHNVIENPYDDMVAAGGDISFFRGSCGHCLARWGNRRNPVTGEIELLFMDGSTKWDYMIAAGEILGLDVHNDFENVILHASNLYAQRDDASQSYIWVVIKD
jgi:hypothetical protein